MAFISFGKTKKEYLSGTKTVTRRAWKISHEEQWQKYWDEGNLVHDAWDKLPFCGGERMGNFKLTCRPYREQLIDMPEEDLLAEGGMCETRSEFYDFIDMYPSDYVTVVRFEKL